MKLDRRIYTGILVARELTKNPENFASAREIAEKLGLPEIPVRQALVRLRRAWLPINETTGKDPPPFRAPGFGGWRSGSGPVFGTGQAGEALYPG